MAKKGKKGRPAGTKKNGIMHLNKTQITDLIGATSSLRNKLILKLTYFLGLRVSELAAIRKGDIDIDLKAITIQGKKNGRKRTYKLPDKLWEMLAEWLNNNPGRIVFSLSISGIQLIFKTAAKKAGLNKDYSIHSLRHSTAIMMAESKKQTGIQIMKWLRHKDIGSTQIYFEQVLFQDQDDEMDKMFNEVL